MGNRARWGLLCAGLAVAVATGPGSGLAALSPSGKGASFSLDAELSRLEELRESLVHRRALQQALERRFAGLADEIGELEARREQTWATLRGERDEEQALAHRLDYLVPRVLARQSAVQQRREQAARLLADLASASRRVQLDPTVRARMLAISPLLLRRLQTAKSGLSFHERQPDRLIARQDEIARRVPLLIAEAERLQGLREATERQRQIVSTRLEQLTAEVQQLSSKQQLLAERAFGQGIVRSAFAGPKADQPALPAPAKGPAAVSVHNAAVKGLLAERPRPAFALHAVRPASSQAVAVAPKSVTPARADATVYAALPAVAPPPAKPLGTMLDGDLGSAALSLGAEVEGVMRVVEGAMPAVEGVMPVDVVFRRPGPLAAVEPRVAPARLQRSQAPIRPSPDELANPFRELRGADLKPGISIVAMPRQAVAAPDDGRVVFAGPFKSYGLLLIIEHQREYHTLLWGFSRLDVAIGDSVRNGQLVGIMAADAERPAELHVEVRRNGRPVNSLPWLAASSNKVRG